LLPLLRATRLQQVYGELPRLLIETVAMVGMMVVVILMLILGRPLPSVLPSLSLFAIAALRVMPSMNRIVNAASNLRYYVPPVLAIAADILADSVDSFDATSEGAQQLQFRGSIYVDHVTYRYQGAERDALDDITIEIPKGRSVAFVGASGAGKTTLADVVLGLLAPTAGRVLIDGCELGSVQKEWQARIGYIPQTVYLSDDTLRRNVAFGVADADVRDSDVWAALDAARLGDVARGLPDGLDSFVGERGVRLSGGQRQRIGIARALYHDPDVLVMDEATSALDQRTERDITDVLEAFRGQKTIIVIAHRLSTVRRCDTLFLMSDGRVMESGTFDDLSENSQAFRALAAIA
jgi:ATP-binding cassette subfamily C protein